MNINNVDKPEMQKLSHIMGAMKDIKTGSPVHKINFDIDNANAVVGFYLISNLNIEEFMIDKIDKKDLAENTLLVFESRHVIECCQIIYGCLYLLMQYKIIDNKNIIKFIDAIINKLLIRPKFYTDITMELNHTIGEFINLELIKKEKMPKIIIDNFSYILNNIWFLPYSEIDNIAEIAANEYSKSIKRDNTEVGDNNE